MEIFDRLDDVAALVEGAKALPLSQSCVVPRDELLDLLDDVREAIPDQMREAMEILERRDDIIADAAAAAAEQSQQADTYAEWTKAEARAEAERVVAAAKAHGRRLVASHEIVAGARDEAERISAEARAEARRVMTQAEAQAAALMAATEDALDMALSEVRRRRNHLRAAVLRDTAEPPQADAAGDFFDIEATGGFDSRSLRY